MSFAETCHKIELILSDVDGVMTDGGIHLLDDGRQMIMFHIRDGMGMRLWRGPAKDSASSPAAHWKRSAAGPTI